MRLRSVLAVGAIALALSGCATDPQGPADDLRAALRRTSREPVSFVYKEATTERELTVQGVVEDDYRYKVAVVLNTVPIAEEAARDDALAVRFLQPAAFDIFVKRNDASAGDAPAGAEAGRPAAEDASAALARQGWVVDPEGAPDLAEIAGAKRTLGDDPILDALTVFDYVEDAIGSATRVTRFNPEALDYIAREDTFPKPEKKSGVIRYDLRPPRIADRVENTPGQGLPEAAHFRRLSVYVKDGRVLQVLEDIDVVARLERLVEAVDLPGRARSDASTALEALNRARALQGSQPIRARRMSLDVVDLGQVRRVELAESATQGDLSMLKNRGRRRVATDG